MTPLEQTLLRACKLALKHTSTSDEIPASVDGALKNAIRLAEKANEPKAPLVECDNCGGRELRCETADIPDLHQRMEAGGEVPAGECAKCGCLSYLKEGDQVKINGLIVDTQKIADGLYEIICAKDEESIVAFGMIPKWIVDHLETMLREKLIAVAAAKLEVSPEDLAPYIDEKLVRATVDPIVRQVTTEIYGSAQRAGRMIV